MGKRNYDFKYVMTDYKPKKIIFRLRVYLSERLIPTNLNFYGREKVIGYIDRGGKITKEHCGHIRKSDDKE